MSAGDEKDDDIAALLAAFGDDDRGDLPNKATSGGAVPNRAASGGAVMGGETAQDLAGPMAQAILAVTAGTANTGIAADGADAADAANTTDDDDDFGLFDSAALAATDRRRAPSSTATEAATASPAVARDGADFHVGAAMAAVGPQDSAQPPHEAPQSAAELAVAALHAAIAVETATARAVLGLGRLLRVCEAENVPKEQALAAAQATAKALQDATVPMALTFAGASLFRDDALVVTLPEAAVETVRLGRALAAVGRTGLAFASVPSPRDLLIAVRILALVARGEQAPNQAAASAMILTGAVGRPDAEALVAAVVSRAMSLVDEIDRAPSLWRFGDVVAQLDALDEALVARAGAVFRAVSLGGTDASIARVAVEMTVVALHVGRICGVSTQTRRAVAHLALALALTGTDDAPPPGIVDAANLAATRLLAALQGARIDPHRLRVAALLGVIARGDNDDDALGAPRWSRLLHRLVRRRRSEKVMWPLLGLLASAAEEPAFSAWAAATLSALGGLPVGSVVALDGGSRGVVVDVANGRVLVDCDGKVNVAERPVALASPR